MTARCDVTLETLPELLQAYLAKSQETTYKKRFPWIDNIFEVRDKAKQNQLDATLVVVDKAIEGIPSTDFKPIDFTEGEDEGRYNKRLSASITDACCPDRDPVLHGGGRSRVEFCDVYTPSRQMIHVKRYAGSSVLSHLFAQGVVSATTFLSDERFREKVNKLLPVSLQIATPATKPNAADYEIAFFVASRSAGPLSLPFFSRVTLRNAYTQLTTFGFRTTLTKVQVV